MNQTRCLGACLVAVLPAVPAPAATMEKKSLDLEGARKVIAAPVAIAKEKGAPGGAIAVVDDGGKRIAVERLDGTFPAAANISIGKARTAAIFQRPTSFFEEIVNQERTTMVALEDFTPLQGGDPVRVDGTVVGAVGVSGAASAKQDSEIAEAAAAAVTDIAMSQGGKGGQPVTYIEGTMVSAAFAKGIPLLENEEYTVHASRPKNRAWPRSMPAKPTSCTSWMVRPPSSPAAPRSIPRPPLPARFAGAGSRGAKSTS